jgi:hypothetical protein
MRVQRHALRMKRTISPIAIRSALRPLCFVLLICVLMFQFVEPVVAGTSQASTPEHHMTMDHSSMAHTGTVGMAHDISEMDAEHQGAAHCMTLMCCFHETTAPFKLIASDVLLPSEKGIEQAMTLPSHVCSAEDRPPQQI